MMGGFINSWDSHGNSAIKGILYINADDGAIGGGAARYATFHVTGVTSVGSPTPHYEIAVKNGHGSGTWAGGAGDHHTMVFVPAGPTAAAGPTGPGGSGSGGGGSGSAAVIAYEPYNPHIMLSEWPLSDAHIWYVQFFAPATGDYTHMTFFATNSSSNSYSGTIGVAIYTDIEGKPGEPGALIASGVPLPHSNANVDQQYITIPFSAAANLTAHTRYWAAIAADNTTGLVFSGFHNDYHGIYDIVKYQRSGFSTGNGFPSNAATGNDLIDGEYAYWFRIHNPDATFGGAGPTGSRGPTGSAGKDGIGVPGNSMIPYEPGALVMYDQEGHHALRGMDAVGNDKDFTIWYQSFICPTTGTYKNCTLFSTSKTTDSIGAGELGVCIYKNKANSSGDHSLPDGEKIMGQGSLEFTNSSSKSWDSRFVEIIFDEEGVDLSANELYWIAFSYKKTSGELFMATKNIGTGTENNHLASQIALRSTTVFWVGSSGGKANFPSKIVPRESITATGVYASWFRLYDPDASFLVGPTGSQGPIGPAGPKGADGEGVPGTSVASFVAEMSVSRLTLNHGIQEDDYLHIPWSEITNTNSDVFSIVPDNIIKINRKSDYRIDINLVIDDGGGKDANVLIRIFKNGSIINGSRGGLAISSAQPEKQYGHKSIIIQCDIGDEIKVAAKKWEPSNQKTVQLMGKDDSASTHEKNWGKTTIIVHDLLGLKGDAGADGAAGAKGEQGIQGNQGVKGDAGADGVKGDKGDVGAQGIQGEKGDAGTDGVKGDKGDDGAQGIQGVKGDAGTDGVKGDKGDTGAHRASKA